MPLMFSTLAVCPAHIDGEAPAGGGGKLLVLDWFPVAGYRWRVGSPAALDVLSDKVQNIIFYVNLIRPGLTLDHHIRHR